MEWWSALKTAPSRARYPADTGSAQAPRQVSRHADGEALPVAQSCLHHSRGSALITTARKDMRERALASWIAISIA